MAEVVTRETILQELEGLAEEQMPEVLDFIRFLKFRGEEKRIRRRFAAAIETARAIAKERQLTDEDVLTEICAVRARK